MVLVGGVLGLRWSEAIALRVRDVDFLRRTVTVSQTVEEVAGVVEIVAAGLPESLTFHGLRHVAATYLEEIDAPLRVRQHRLGHAAQGVTLRTYTHVPVELDRAVTDRLGNLFVSADRARKAAAT